MKNIYHFIFLIFGIMLPFGLASQDFTALINSAWQVNDQLKAKNFQLQVATIALSEAKSMYGPSIVFGGSYTLASGGRSIDFPVGDLLNPVYSTLNQLTQSNVFPRINNVETQLLPNNFYDARFRVSQPIFYPDLAINKKLKSESIDLKSLEVKAFKRQISKEVMLAYFQFNTSKNVLEIYKSADTLLVEAKRTTQSMIKNGVSLPSALSRIETQISNIKAKKIDAAANQKNASRYFNYVVQKKISDEVLEIIPLPELPDTLIQQVQQREEIDQLNQSIKIQQLVKSKEDMFYLPKVGAQLDLGSQEFDFGWQPYALFGLNVEINIFDNKRHTLRKKMASSEILATEAQKNQVDGQMNLLVQLSKENLQSAIAQAKTYKSRINASNKIYDEVFKKYKEGTSNYLELIDAQTQLTQIQLEYLIAQNNAWSRWAEYVYATASYPIDK